MVVQYTQRRVSLPARFPNSIREYRLKAGLTQAELASSLGHGRSVVSAWERGRTLPTLANALRLAKTLNTLTESLYVDLYCARQGRTDRSPNPSE